jgi:hypothetical protein
MGKKSNKLHSFFSLHHVLNRVEISLQSMKSVREARKENNKDTLFDRKNKDCLADLTNSIKVFALKTTEKVQQIFGLKVR